MQIGSVARLATLLTGLSQPQTVTGKTDGRHTDLTFSPDASTGASAFNSVDGMFAGETVHINCTPENPAGTRDLVLHMRNDGGDVPVDLTVRESNLFLGCNGVQLDGTIDGKAVKLNWDMGAHRLQGEVDSQSFALQSSDEPIPDDADSLSGTLTGGLGKGSIDLTTLAHLRTIPNHFGARGETGFDVQGQLSGVLVDEHEIPYHGFLSW